jgi:hypothetical protein
MDAYASIKIRLKVHLAFGYTDMRKGIDGLAMLVQGVAPASNGTAHAPLSHSAGAYRAADTRWDIGGCSARD